MAKCSLNRKTVMFLDLAEFTLLYGVSAAEQTKPVSL